MDATEQTPAQTRAEPVEPSAALNRPAQAPSPGSGKWNRWEVILLIVLVLLGGAIRFIRLDQPREIVFDETYYAKDACLYIGHDPGFCGAEKQTEQSYVHPPLGKSIISLGIRAFGYYPFGWRFMAAAFGTALIALTYLLTRKLFDDRWIAAIAAFLVSTDFLLIVQSRMAMLDIFLTFFVVAGFLFLVFDRARLLELKKPSEALIPDLESTTRHFRWRLGAGAAFGLAISVKWSGVWALFAALLLTLTWLIDLANVSRKTEGTRLRNIAKFKRRELTSMIVGLLVVPGLIYLTSYSPYLVKRLKSECPYTVPVESKDRLFDDGIFGKQIGTCVEGVQGALLSFADLHDRMLNYHLSLTAKHDYQSKAWTWPLVLRPVAYHYEGKVGKATHTLAFGNILVWWPTIAAALWLVLTGFRKGRAERVTLVAWAAQYVPWLVVNRPLFFFYMTPAVPFMMTSLAVVLRRIARKNKVTRGLVIAYLVVAVGIALFYFYPVITASTLPQNLWFSRMWIKGFTCGGLKCGWI